MSIESIEPLIQSLNKDFVELKSKLESIVKKYEDLEKKLEKQKKSSFKCRKCKKEFPNLKKLRKHRDAEHEMCSEEFKCEECEKEFKNSNLLELHKRKHEKFECEECDRVFGVEGLLEKHVSAVHGKMKIFCHYFNNEKSCNYGNECIFAHEESPDCKLGELCERIMCMFKHDRREISDDEEDTSDEESDEENESDRKEFVNVMDLEPSFKKVEESMSRITRLLENSQLICEFCEFVAKNANGLNMHKKSKHTTDKSN